MSLYKKHSPIYLRNACITLLLAQNDSSNNLAITDGACMKSMRNAT